MLLGTNSFIEYLLLLRMALCMKKITNIDLDKP